MNEAMEATQAAAETEDHGMGYPKLVPIAALEHYLTAYRCLDVPVRVRYYGAPFGVQEGERTGLGRMEVAKEKAETFSVYRGR
jgi:hypothetical protein